jgi:DNA-binding PadR family transcriptional regulator
MEELEKITSEKYNPEPGTVYTLLRRMEKRGLLVSKWISNISGTDRREYTITDSGINTLKKMLEVVKSKKQLMDNLIKFYDSQLLKGK